MMVASGCMGSDQVFFFFVDQIGAVESVKAASDIVRYIRVLYCLSRSRPARTNSPFQLV